jgi:superfamily I DNA/RNA helicase
VVNSIAVFEHDETVEKRDLFSYLEKVALLTSEDNEEQEKKPNAVTLLTMHSCKGLEFPHVFISAVEEGSIPHQKSIEEGEEKIEEERRLFYVGVTRAMRSLCLSFAAVRRRYGDELEAIPSRFIEEIPPELLEFVDAAENEPLSAAQLDAGFGALQAEWEKRLQEP